MYGRNHHQIATDLDVPKRNRLEQSMSENEIVCNVRPAPQPSQTQRKDKKVKNKRVVT